MLREISLQIFVFECWKIVLVSGVYLDEGSNLVFQKNKNKNKETPPQKKPKSQRLTLY